MAELLVVAKAHWMDSLTPQQIALLSPHKLANYNARSQIGDILVVKPDNTIWGTKECLPDFVIIQFPNLSVDLVKQYVEPLYDDITKPSHIRVLLKKRKYSVPQAYIANLVVTNQSVVRIAVGQITNFRNTIIAKTI